MRMALTGRLTRSVSGNISSSQTMTGHGGNPLIATNQYSPGLTSRRRSGTDFFRLRFFFLCSGTPAPDLRFAPFLDEAVVPLIGEVPSRRIAMRLVSATRAQRVTFFKQMQTALCTSDSLPYSPPLPVISVFCTAAISLEVAWGEGLGAGLGSGCEWLISKAIDNANVDILTASSLIYFGWLAIVSESDLNGGRLCRILARTRRLLQRLRSASRGLRYSLVCHFAMTGWVLHGEATRKLPRGSRKSIRMWAAQW